MVQLSITFPTKKVLLLTGNLCKLRELKLSINTTEVCVPKLVWNETRQDEIGGHFPNWRDHDNAQQKGTWRESLEEFQKLKLFFRSGNARESPRVSQPEKKMGSSQSRMAGLRWDWEDNVPEHSERYFSQIVTGNMLFPENGIRERRPLNSSSSYLYYDSSPSQQG